MWVRHRRNLLTMSLLLYINMSDCKYFMIDHTMITLIAMGLT
jgi:hypothetical protein